MNSKIRETKVLLDSVPKPSGVFVGSVERAFRIIRAFDEEHSRMTLSEVAARIELTRGTTRRFLQTFVTLGYVHSDGKLFWLSPKILDLGFAYLSASRLPEVCGPVVRRISDQTGESCSVAVLDEDSVVYVHRVQPKRIYSSALEVGSRLPIHASSLGQVLLAHSEDAVRSKVFEQIEYTIFTDATVAGPQAFRDKLDVIRRQGHSLVEGELEAGIMSVAVPIFNRRGELLAAMNIGTLQARTSVDTMISDYLPLLVDGAREIGEMLYT